MVGLEGFDSDFGILTGEGAWEEETAWFAGRRRVDAEISVFSRALLRASGGADA
jgi:hypothetical protein